MKKAVLLQLPVPDLLWPVLDANIPLAAGYLAAVAGKRAKGWGVEILPPHEVDVLGDEALFRAVADRSPDLVGFSLFLWNVERSLSLARRLSEVGIPVVVGGPEVGPDNEWLWRAGGFLGAVVGEGERPFLQLLDAFSGQGPISNVPGFRLASEPRGTLQPCPPVDLATLPSPYLSGCLAPSPDGTIWLETVRGCPFRCAYCHYGKSHGPQRSFRPDWLSGHLSWARDRDVREVYLMDPSFNVRNDWEQVLATLEQGNPGGRLTLHTELVADALRPGDAARLARAGLRSCEVGLQTVRTEVLARVGRAWDRPRWLRGIRELLAAGVSVSVGLIAGLPGDDLAGFEETLSFLQTEVPTATPQVFPLALLPGTALRGRARELGLEFLARPPYTVTRTSGYSSEDLFRVVDRFEEATGLELDALGAPPIGGSWEAGEGPRPYLSGVRVDAARVDGGWPDAVAPWAARNFCVWIRGWDDGIPAAVGRLSRLLPHGVLTVVLEDRLGWPTERLCSLLAEAGTGEHYLDRYFRFLYGPGARMVPRLAVLVEAAERAGKSWLERVRKRADVVWAVDVGPNWVGQVLLAVEDGESAYVRGAPPRSDLARLAAELPEEVGEILFAAPDAEAAWRARPGAEDRPVHRAREYRISLP